MEACQRATRLTPNNARALLGQFLFSGEEAEKPLDGLSGGERQRLSLAILVHSGANVLILDEPTNHLDLESREALGGRACSTSRARCCSSPTTARCSTRSARAPSRWRTRRCTPTWAAGPSTCACARSAPRRSGSRSAPSRSVGEAAAGAGAEGARRRTSRRARRSSRREIEAAEAALAALEEELADPSAWNDPRVGGEVDRPARGGQARFGGALRALGGRGGCSGRRAGAGERQLRR